MRGGGERLEQKKREKELINTDKGEVTVAGRGVGGGGRGCMGDKW